MPKTAKLFMNGRSQAVRLPAEFRFKGKEVFIRRNEKTGEVILSDKPDWESFFAMRDSMDVPKDFLKGIRDKRPPEDRDLF
jgi:antitoxin VapB